MTKTDPRKWQRISSDGDPYAKHIKVEANGSVTVEYNQTNMAEVLEVNRELQNRDRESSAIWDGDTAVHVARVPEELIHQWMREGINFYRWNEEDRARLMKKLNDSDFAHLRVDRPGVKI